MTLSLAFCGCFEGLPFFLRIASDDALGRNDCAAACKIARNVGAVSFSSCITSFQLNDLSSSADFTLRMDDLGFS